MESDIINLSKQKRRKRRIIFACITIFILFIAFHVFLNTSSNTTSVISPLSAPSAINSLATSPSLAEAIQAILTGTTGTYGVVVKDIATGESYYLNEHKIFQPGSLYKLWIMAVVYQQIQSGNLTKDQVLSQDISVLNDKFYLASESAEQTEGIVSLSVVNALNKMITISDNYSALLLTEKIGLSTVKTFLKTNGFIESSVGTDGSDPTSTANDIALFFEKLYNGQLANGKYTKEMIDLLKSQRLNNKLPKNLLPGVTIAHKTGEITSYSHDAGIVYAPRGEYIIVVLTDSDDPAQAEEGIANVSKKVYEYFTQ